MNTTSLKAVNFNKQQTDVQNNSEDSERARSSRSSGLSLTDEGVGCCSFMLEMQPVRNQEMRKLKCWLIKS